MWVTRLWLYLKGYLQVNIKGEDLGCFVNLCLAQNIAWWDLQALAPGIWKASMPLGRFRDLRSIVRQSGCRVRIIRRIGLPFIWRRLRQRYTFLIGAILFLVGLLLLASFVWTVEIDAASRLKTVSIEQIIEVAAEAGLKPGVMRWRVDPRQVEWSLIKRIPLLSWVAVEVKGTTGNIQVIERTVPPPELVPLPADLVADRPGIITQMLVLAGEARVQVGDPVQPGDVLIAGTFNAGTPPGIPPAAAEGKNLPAVKARGIVRAEVWYESVGQVPLLVEQRLFTGAHRTRVMLGAGSSRWRLWGPAQVPWPEFVVEEQVKSWHLRRNIFPPVELIITNYNQVRTIKHQLQETEAIILATQQAKMRLGALVDKNVITQKVERLAIDPSMVGVRLLVQVEEDIGRWQPLIIQE